MQTQTRIRSVEVRLLPDGRSGELLSDLVALAGGYQWRVPAGFVTDFASVPRVFWRVLPPWGKYSRAAVVHDYLYRVHPAGISRLDADRIFLSLMRQDGVGWATRTAMYRAVRIGGGGAWRSGPRRHREITGG